MRIQEVNREKSLELLANLRLGRIACAQAAQPYVVPFYFAYDDGYLYSFSTVGQKIKPTKSAASRNGPAWLSLVAIRNCRTRLN